MQDYEGMASWKKCIVIVISFASLLILNIKNHGKIEELD